MYGATLLFPNEKMPYEVAATTWTNLLGCPDLQGRGTLDAIRAFGKATWGKYGGEPAEALHLHRADPGRTRQLSCPAPLGRPVGGEEAGGVAAGAEALVGGAVADDLGGVPGLAGGWRSRA